MPHNFGPNKRKPSNQLRQGLKAAGPIVASTLVLAIALFSLPTLLSTDIKAQQVAASDRLPFPVSVDPERKTITEIAGLDQMLEESNPVLTAAAFNASSVLSWLASAVASLPLYKQLAGADIQFVTIHPGYRQEQVATAFANALGWNSKQRAAFLAQVKSTPPTLTEGEFMPGTYEVSGAATPTDVQALLNDRFTVEILNRYSTSTAERVPLNDALTIASMIERETGGTDDMRLISGIIWNRLFIGMNLQIDATLQYAKSPTTKTWWPPVKPADKYIKSPYNTYANKGLPPGPIANPSIASVIAALNPKETDCVFYFHDKYGNFHCSADYAGHVKMLKKLYGQGK